MKNSKLDEWAEAANRADAPSKKVFEQVPELKDNPELQEQFKKQRRESLMKNLLEIPDPKDVNDEYVENSMSYMKQYPEVLQKEMTEVARLYASGQQDKAFQTYKRIKKVNSHIMNNRNMMNHVFKQNQKAKAMSEALPFTPEADDSRTEAVAKDIGRGYTELKTGLIDFVQPFVGIYDATLGKLGEDSHWAKKLYDLKGDVRAGQDYSYEQSEGLPWRWDRAFGGMVRNLTAMIPSARVGSLTAKGIGLAGKAAQRVAMGVTVAGGATREAQNSFFDAKDRGLSNLRAALHAGVQGLAEGGGEYIFGFGGGGAEKSIVKTFTRSLTKGTVTSLDDGVKVLYRALGPRAAALGARSGVEEAIQEGFTQWVQSSTSLDPASAETKNLYRSIMDAMKSASLMGISGGAMQARGERNMAVRDIAKTLSKDYGVSERLLYAAIDTVHKKSKNPTEFLKNIAVATDAVLNKEASFVRSYAQRKETAEEIVANPSKETFKNQNLDGVYPTEKDRNRFAKTLGEELIRQEGNRTNPDIDWGSPDLKMENLDETLDEVQKAKPEDRAGILSEYVNKVAKENEDLRSVMAEVNANRPEGVNPTTPGPMRGEPLPTTQEAPETQGEAKTFIEIKNINELNAQNLEGLLKFSALETRDGEDTGWRSVKIPEAPDGLSLWNEETGETKHFTEAAQAKAFLDEQLAEKEAPKVPEQTEQVKPAQKEEATKEPWQMTRDEYSELKGYDPKELPMNRLTEKEMKRYPITRDVDLAQIKAIKQAQSEGKAIPQEVLNDYPELDTKQKAEAPTAVVEEIKDEMKDPKSAVADKRIKSEILTKLNDALENETEEITGLKKEIQFSIPGDDTFKIWNTEANLKKLLKRVKQLNTKTGDKRITTKQGAKEALPTVDELVKDLRNSPLLEQTRIQLENDVYDKTYAKRLRSALESIDNKAAPKQEEVATPEVTTKEAPTSKLDQFKEGKTPRAQSRIQKLMDKPILTNGKANTLRVYLEDIASKSAKVGTIQRRVNLTDSMRTKLEAERSNSYRDVVRERGKGPATTRREEIGDILAKGYYIKEEPAIQIGEDTYINKKLDSKTARDYVNFLNEDTVTGKPMLAEDALDIKTTHEEAYEAVAKILGPKVAVRVAKNAIFTERGHKALGKFADGNITLIEEQDNPLGTAYHEATHYALDLLVTPKQRNRLLGLFGGNEENLANSFSYYMQTGEIQKPPTIGFFHRLRNFLNKLRNKDTQAELKKFYDKLASGEYASKTMKNDPVAIRVIREYADGILQIIAPARRAKAQRAAVIKGTAQAKQRFPDARAIAQTGRFSGAMWYFNWHMSDAEGIDFIDNITEGKPQKNKRLDGYAKLARSLLDATADAVETVSNRPFRYFGEKYFPFIYDVKSDPSGAPSVRKSSNFMKERKYGLREALDEKKLEMKHANPMDAVLERVFQMNAYVAGERLMKDLIDQGVAKFMPSSLEKQMNYPGHRLTNDEGFRVKAIPKYLMDEYYDKLVMEQLTTLVENLGITHERVNKIPGRALGKSTKGVPFIKTQFGSPISMMLHEIGHQVSDKHGLYDFMLHGEHTTVEKHKTGKYAGQPIKSKAQKARSTIQNEMRALANLRIESIPKELVTPSIMRYIRKGAEKEAIMFEAWLAAPEKMEKVAPTVTKIFKQFLSDHAEYSPILNLNRSVMVEHNQSVDQLDGTLEVGRWAFPNEVADLLDNYIAPGLMRSKNRAIKDSYNAIRFMANVMNMIQLTASGFHAINVSVDAVATQMAEGLLRIQGGDLKKGTKMMATAPGAPIRLFREGSKLRKTLLTTEDLDLLPTKEKELLEDLMSAGGRVTPDSFYFNKMWPRMSKSLRNLKFGTGVDKTKSIAILPIQSALMLSEVMAAPIMKSLVPNLKVGSFILMASEVRAEAARKGWNDAKIDMELHRAWESADNRMGQMTYDNLNWNTTFKEILMLSTRSVGWNLGSIREFGGALKDFSIIGGRVSRGERILTRRMAYAMSVTSMYMTISTIVQFMLTGEWPEELKDFFYPKTGKTENGIIGRLNPPFYSKDWFAVADSPIRTIKHKAHPIISMVAALATNEDYFGVEIRDSDAPIQEQMVDAAKYVGSNLMPFSVKNLPKFIKSGMTPLEAALISFSGIGPAPRYISYTPAQRAMSDAYKDRGFSIRRTKEQAKKSKRRATLRNIYRKGERPTKEDLKGFTYRELERIYNESSLSSNQGKFKRLSYEEALSVYSVANKQERREFRPFLIDKYRRYHRDASADANAFYMELIRGPRTDKGSS